MRAAIPVAQQKIALLKSGNVCAFPNCDRTLLLAETRADGAAVIAELAHIVAASRQGPRGDVELDEESRNLAKNLIVLCPEHHAVIDAQPRTYSVPVLRQMKADHERRIAAAGARGRRSETTALTLVSETLYSTLLPITHIPSVMFAGPSPHGDSEYESIKEQIRSTRNRWLLPFLLKDGLLLTFYDLRVRNSPFKPFVRGDVQQFAARDLWQDPEGARRYKTLLNRSMHKYAGRQGVRFDPGHHRYFFEPTEPGKVREIHYRLKSGATSKRKVVWQPITRATGVPKTFWIHLAASLNFVQLAEQQWALAIRPERHLTSDSQQPLAPHRIGRRVTRLKAKMYNDKYLGELQFWLSFLSRDKPRLLLEFGSQSVVIDARLVWFNIRWPGISHDVPAKPIESVEDDLFTLSDLQAAAEGEPIYDDDEEEDALTLATKEE